MTIKPIFSLEPTRHLKRAHPLPKETATKSEIRLNSCQIIKKFEKGQKYINVMKQKAFKAIVYLIVIQ